MTRRRRAGVAAAAAVALLVFLATWNLASWPEMWFDEGSHLKVPKSLVLFGVYADYDDTGFRYFGPTFGVGPTVLVPIAAAFKVWGINLLVARAVMAIYLVAAVLAYYGLARAFAGARTAFVASVLLVVMPGVGTLEYGRQVLGEVPGLLFLCLGLLLLVRGTERQGSRAGWLAGAGLCLGLAAVTKYQYLLTAVPGLGLAWLLTRRGNPTVRLFTFAVPTLVMLGVFAAWQAVLLGLLGPGSMSENLALFRTATQGAALGFALDRVLTAASALAAPGVFLGALVPALAYGLVRALKAEAGSFGWSLVVGCAIANLTWFVVASIGWPRYAFAGLALSCIPVAGLLVEGTTLLESPAPVRVRGMQAGWAWIPLVWLGAMLVMSAFVILPEVLVSRPVPAVSMAARVTRTVPEDAVVETWEPELTFLTDHRYRMPPPSLLPVAVRHISDAGPPPFVEYNFLARGAPDYVVLGPFATWVHSYRGSRLRQRYEVVGEDPPYLLFRRKPQPAEFFASAPPR